MAMYYINVNLLWNLKFGAVNLSWESSIYVLCIVIWRNIYFFLKTNKINLSFFLLLFVINSSMGSSDSEESVINTNDVHNVSSNFQHSCYANMQINELTEKGHIYLNSSDSSNKACVDFYRVDNYVIFLNKC